MATFSGDVLSIPKSWDIYQPLAFLMVFFCKKPQMISDPSVRNAQLLAAKLHLGSYVFDRWDNGRGRLDGHSPHKNRTVEAWEAWRLSASSREVSL